MSRHASLDHDGRTESHRRIGLYSYLIMRVHRIGQSRPVSVYQLVMRESVEIGVLALQRKKQALFDSTIGRMELTVFFF